MSIPLLPFCTNQHTSCDFILSASLLLLPVTTEIQHNLHKITTIQCHHVFGESECVLNSPNN